jgi:hypothetical protein
MSEASVMVETRVAAVYGITSITGVEANSDYSVLHTGNSEFFIYLFFSNNLFFQSKLII